MADRAALPLPCTCAGAGGPMLCRPDRDDCVLAATRDEALQCAGPLLRAGVPPPSSKARRHRPPCCDAWHLRCYRQPLPIALPMPLVPGRVATGQAVLSAAPCERQSGRMLAIHPTSAPGLGAPLSRSLGDLLCTQFVNSLDDSIATLLRRVDRVRLVGCGTSGRALRPRSPSPPGGRMPGFPLDFERLTAACAGKPFDVYAYEIPLHVRPRASSTC